MRAVLPVKNNNSTELKKAPREARFRLAFTRKKTSKSCLKCSADESESLRRRDTLG